MVAFIQLKKLKLIVNGNKKVNHLNLNQLSIFQNKELLNDIKKDVYY